MNDRTMKVEDEKDICQYQAELRRIRQAIDEAVLEAEERYNKSIDNSNPRREAYALGFEAGLHKAQSIVAGEDK